MRIGTTLSAIGAAFILTLFVTSCQREPDINEVERVTNMPDSMYLNRFVFLDTTLPAPSDTVYYSLYIYDNEGRIKNWYLRQPYADPTYLDTFMIATYFYNGNDTLPYKMEMNEAQDDELVFTSFVSSFWKYDNMGRMISDSTKSEWEDNGEDHTEIHTSSFTYTGADVFYQAKKKKTIMPAGDMYEDIIKGKVRNTIANNCIVRQVDSMLHVYTEDGFATSDTMRMENIADLQYDANLNPLLRAHPACYPVFNHIWFGFYDGWEQLHNLVKADVTNKVYYTTGSTSYLSSSNIYSYGYRSDGLPIVRRDVVGPGMVYKNALIYGR